MLILDRASEEKLDELVKTQTELNKAMRNAGMLIRRNMPDRATLLWFAIDREIERKKEEIAEIQEREAGCTE